MVEGGGRWGKMGEGGEWDYQGLVQHERTYSLVDLSSSSSTIGISSIHSGKIIHFMECTSQIHTIMSSIYHCNC
jgi:hypothetical protein